MRKPKLKTVPKFKDADEEFAFWSKADFLDYFEAKKFRRASFPNLKRTDPSHSEPGSKMR